MAHVSVPRVTNPVRRRLQWLQIFVPARTAVRTVEVAPPSSSDEASWVFLTATFICLCVLYTLAFQLHLPVGSAGDRRTASPPLPFLVLFRDLPGKEQRIFRVMQEGLQEGLRMRGKDGEWPSVDTLAALDIPPFAIDVLDKSGLTWTQHRDGPLVEYLGTPARGTDTPAFLIFIQEPGPNGSEQFVPSVVDEEHQLLPDGKLLHVTYWKHAPGSVRRGSTSDPALEGWLQIRITNPFQELEQR